METLQGYLLAVKNTERKFNQQVPHSALHFSMQLVFLGFGI